jgi:hypothetical protein
MANSIERRFQFPSIAQREANLEELYSKPENAAWWFEVGQDSLEAYGAATSIFAHAGVEPLKELVRRGIVGKRLSQINDSLLIDYLAETDIELRERLVTDLVEKCQYHTGPWQDSDINQGTNPLVDFLK